MNLMTHFFKQDLNKLVQCQQAFMSTTRKHAGSKAKPEFKTMVGLNMLTLREFSEKQIEELLWTAMDMKAMAAKSRSDELTGLLSGLSLAAIFQKRSTRTRFAIEAGAHSLGAHAVYCNQDDIHLGEAESVRDTSLVLSRLTNLIAARVHEHGMLDEIAKYAKVPVVNALSDLHHPTQALADLMTIYEHFGHLKGLRVAWVGDGSNVLNSLLIACTKMKMNISFSTPIGYEPCKESLDFAESLATINETEVVAADCPDKAIANADVVITDTWVSMGQEETKSERLKAFQGYQITLDMILKNAQKNWIFMHCLPRKKDEVEDLVFYHKQSLVFQEAENRKWTTMAVLANLLNGYSPTMIKTRHDFVSVKPLIN